MTTNADGRVASDLCDQLGQVEREENNDEFLRLVEAECSPAAKLYAEIERLKSEVMRLKRGECICIKCGLRQNATKEDDTPDAPFMF